jgi:hypothetical protein
VESVLAGVELCVEELLGEVEEVDAEIAVFD